MHNLVRPGSVSLNQTWSESDRSECPGEGDLGAWKSESDPSLIQTGLNALGDWRGQGLSGSEWSGTKSLESLNQTWSESDWPERLCAG